MMGVVFRPDSDANICVIGGDEIGVGFRVAQTGTKRNQITEILIHALVDPQQVGLLRNLKVRRREIVRPAVLSVPRVRELVRHQVGVGDVGLRVRQKIIVRPIIARLVVLDALKRDRVAKGQQCVIIGEMTRPIKRKRFGGDAFVGA